MSLLERFILLVTIVFAILVFPSFAEAGSLQEIETYREIKKGTLQLHSAETEVIEAPILKTQVDFDISGLTARVKVKQEFHNQTANWVEGIYLFPLPEKSAVDSLQIKIGERVIVGEIKEKKEAKRIYQKAKKDGKKASLVEQHRPNVFTNSVANIAPFEKVEVTIEYQQELSFAKDGSLNIRFPMTMTPRYTPNSMISERFDGFKQGFQFTPSVFENIDLPQKSSLQAGNDVEIKVNLDSGIPLASLSSKSHQISYQQSSVSSYQVSLAGANNKANRDFILSWLPIAGSEPRAALFNETIDNQHYVSLMVMPPQQKVTDISLPREVIFVIDTSGSMGGESIRQAKKALIYGLSTLRYGDKFNVIEFNSATDSLYVRPKNYTESSYTEAVNFVRQLNANGGTEMLSAMNRALDSHSDNNRVRQVLFLTDGAISNESELFKIISKKLGDSRLFTVGIGSAPNAFFMKRAAQFGRGTFTFIADVNESEKKISQLFKQISQPLLSNIEIEWPQNSNVEMWPEKAPDLFSGEPLWIKAKVAELNGELAIKGRMANSLWETHLSLSPGQSHPGIAKLWAREKIASIMNQARHGQVNLNQKQIIIDTALKHHLVSRFTSLIAVDKTPSRNEELLVEKRIQQVAPKGSEQAALNYASTAIDLYLTPQQALWIIVLAFAGLILIRRFDGATHE